MPEYDCFYLQLSSPQTRSPAHSESLRWCKLIDWVRCESGACKCNGESPLVIPVTVSLSFLANLVCAEFPVIGAWIICVIRITGITRITGVMMKNALNPTFPCLQCQCWLHRCTSSSGVQCHQRSPTKNQLQRSHTKNQHVTTYKVSAIACD